MSALLYAKKPWGVCRCGHFQWQHGKNVDVKDEYGIPHTRFRADGHGKCNHQDCDCPQFTWVRFATEEEME